ncbi:MULTISPECIES: hypothetical protein [unclassified Haladaptatus]|uniref:hypothetical protein n=1 Tax=unclassified Haladaptatus TaxID=2622732 RepID=UPI0023E7792C|nr:MULTISPECIES: hypothetical protein [unclassified Haladaptatus]
MTAPRFRRRQLLTLTGVGLSGALTACLDTAPSDVNTSTETPEPSRTPPSYDCGAAYRPEPNPPRAENAVEPKAYPSRPESIENGGGIVEYVTEYEKAYRVNSLLAQYGDRLTNVSIWIDETRTYDAPEQTALVRVQYRYSETVETEDGAVIGDSPRIFVTYYVDQSVVIRAESTGASDDSETLHPDPWRGGRTVDCFGS